MVWSLGYIVWPLLQKHFCKFVVTVFDGVTWHWLFCDFLRNEGFQYTLVDLRGGYKNHTNYDHSHKKSEIKKFGTLFSYICGLSPPLAKGGWRITPSPLAIFLNFSKNEYKYRHTTYGILFSINLTFSNKISAIPVETFLRKWRFSGVMSCDFGSKNGQLSRASRM